MATEDASRNNKTLCKQVLRLIKVIPMMLAMFALLTTLMDYCLIDSTLVNYIILSLLIAFLYMCSYLFKFCAYHRMFLHYFVGMNLISVYDAYIRIPVNAYGLMQIYTIFTGICLFIILYLYVKSHKKTIVENHQRH